MLWGAHPALAAPVRPDRAHRRRRRRGDRRRRGGRHRRRRARRSRPTGSITQDQPVFASDVVRYVGEPVAAVAADHPETCRRALRGDRRRVRGARAADSTPRRRSTAAAADPPRRQRLPPPAHRVRRPGASSATSSSRAPTRSACRTRRSSGSRRRWPCPTPAATGVELYVATQWLHEDRKPDRRLPRPARGAGAARRSAASAARSAPARTSACRCTRCLLALRTGRPGADARTRGRRASSATSTAIRRRIWMRHHATADGEHRQDRGPLRARRRRLRVDVVGGADQRASPTPRARTGAPTPSSTAGRCAPTTCRAGRCAGSASCRRASPTRARWTSWPRRAGSTRSRSGCATRSRTGDRLDHRPGDRERGAGRPLHPRDRRAAAARRAGRRPRRRPDAPARRRRPHRRRVARACAASATRSAIKNLMYSEGFDDYSTARCRLADGVATLKFATAEVGQGFVTIAPQIARDDPRRRRGRARADRHHDRLGRLDVGVAPDVDERRGGRRGLPGRARAAVRARRRRRTASTRCASRSRAPTSSTRVGVAARLGRRRDAPASCFDETFEYHHRPTEELDENGQGNCHTAFAFVAHRAVVDVDPELGLVQGRAGRHRAGRRACAEPAVGDRPDRGRHRPGPRPGGDGGDRPDRRAASATPASPTTCCRRCSTCPTCRGDADRGARSAGTARGQGRGRAAVHLVDAGDRGRDPRSPPGATARRRAGAPSGHRRLDG